jgi:lipoprotein-anchoring transpeptidase ErfK/SrfK
MGRAAAVALAVLFVLTGWGSDAPAVSQLSAADVTEPLVMPAPTSTPPPSPTPTPTPASTPTPSRTTKPKPTSTPSPTCPQGTKQREVETALAKIGSYGAITVDGRQTLADCETIKRFQRRMGIYPIDGRAGPTTADVSARIAATDIGACAAGDQTMACVDLTNQTFYLMKGGTVAVGPTVTRTGMKGFATPAGTFTINDRATTHWSIPYLAWLPYWQHFYNGDGLHETTTYIHNKAIGSHGCVNLLRGDAARAYSLLTIGSKVRLYGRRPGT